MTGFSATGIGSWPGVDADEATRIVAGELPDLPHVVELPARGPGADMVGRTMALLAECAPDLAVETTPAGWRFADAPGRVMRRARSWLAEDLDRAQAHFAGSMRVKSQLCGPWTLASAVEMRNGERAVRDPGACRDIAAAMAEVVGVHIVEIKRRLPHSEVIVQIDEPSLPAVLAGGVSTASGIATYRSIDPQVAQGHLSGVVAAIEGEGAQAWAHCCAGNPPVSVFERSGFAVIATDAYRGRSAEELGAFLDSGRCLALGVIGVPTQGMPARILGEQAARQVLDQMHRWGFSPEVVAERIILTPACGLAGLSPIEARTVYRAIREAGRLIRDDEGVASHDPEATE